MDQEPTAFVDDFSVDRAFDDNVRARFDGQATENITANMKGAVPLHDRVVENRAMDIGRAADQQRPVLGSLF
jgi:hypothetical protein